MTDKERNRRFKSELRKRLKQGLAIRKDTYGELVKLLKEAEASIIATLTNSPTEWEQFYLAQLQQQIRATLKDVETRAAGTMTQAAGTSWQAGIDLVDKPIEAAGVRLAGVLPHISTDQLVAMRTFMVDRIKDVPIQLANKISAQLGLTMMGAQSVGDTITNVQTLFKKQGRSRALTIVRTELGRAYSVASHQRKTQAAEYLPGLKKQWRRSGKVHSRVAHDTADGQIRDVDKPFTLGNGKQLMFPRDPKADAAETINCGCEELPYMESWEVTTPGKKPYSAEEIALNPIKAGLAQAM